MRLRLAIICGLLSVIVAPCAATRTSCSTEASIVGGIWLHVDGEWVSSPADSNIPRLRSAPATLVQFSTDGSFSMLRCYIIEHANTLTISRGDPHMIYTGHWIDGEPRISIRYRLMYERVAPVGGGTYPGPEETGTARLVGKTLQVNGKEYVDVGKKLHITEYEEFIAPVRTRITTN